MPTPLTPPPRLVPLLAGLAALGALGAVAAGAALHLLTEPSPPPVLVEIPDRFVEVMLHAPRSAPERSFTSTPLLGDG